MPYSEQLMSKPQHIGDLIFPSHTGQREIWTLLPSSIVNVSFTSGWSHFAQVAWTDIPHFWHEYVAIITGSFCSTSPSNHFRLAGAEHGLFTKFNLNWPTLLSPRTTVQNSVDRLRNQTLLWMTHTSKQQSKHLGVTASSRAIAASESSSTCLLYTSPSPRD